MTTPANYQQLGQAMRMLAGRCDHAAAEDGQGFNKADTTFGHVLAETPVEKWSPKMASIAYDMATKYRRQLASYGLDVSKIAKPSSVDQRKNGKPKVTAFDSRVDGDSLILTSKAYPGFAAINAVKACPGREFKKTPRPMWVVPMAAAAHLLRAQVDGHVVMSAKTLATLRERLSDQVKAAEDSHRADADFEVADLGGELRPFQRAGVAYGSKHRRCWIADEMGLGKTVQALAVLQHTKALPAVVAVPASLKLGWQREAEKWLPTVRRIQVVSGRKPIPIPRDVGIVIINYDVLDAWVSTLITAKPKALILDESHYCKSGKTRRTKAAKAIANCGTVKVRLLLSGTPVVNSPPDLIAQLYILDRMKDLGGYRAFVDRYCIPSQWGGFARGGRNLHELNARMRSLGMFIRRLKKDVLTELPDKVRSLVPIDLKNRRIYDEAQRRVARKITAARIERERASKEGRAPEGWALAASVTGITELRKIAAECKLPAALDWIRGMLDAGEKLVIFAHHTEIVERIASELSCPMIKGGVKAEARQQAVDQFQNDEDTRAIVLNIRAGGVGLTLTAASNVVFVESGWTPADNDQAEDRCHRIGQRDSVTAWYLLGNNTIDQWMADLVAKKRLTVDAATEGDEKMQASVVEELAGMLEAAERTRG